MENKFWENFKKIAGGLTITFSVFFMLLGISFFQDNPDFIATNIGKIAPKTPAVIQEIPSTNNFLSGKFNLKTNGNVVYSYGDGKLYHYKTIKDVSLIKIEKNPRLMLEIKDSQGKIAWEKTEISWIDTQQGILFFHFKTVNEDGTETKPQDFTGNYQLILE